MAENTKVFTLQIRGVETSIKSINELEQAIQDTDEALKDVEIGSDAYNQLAKEADKAKTQLNKINQSLEGGFDEKKVKAIQDGGKALAGVFSIATVASDAFGVSSKSLEEAQARAVQLIAVTNSLKDVIEFASAENIKFAKTAIEGFKNSAIGAKLFGLATKEALIATGIGAFVVILTSIIIYWDDITEAINGTTEAQKNYFDELEKGQAKAQEDLNAYISSLELQNKILQIQGDNEKTIFENRRKIIDEQIENQTTVQDNIKEEIDLYNKVNDIIKGKLDVSVLTTKENEKMNDIIDRIAKTEGGAEAFIKAKEQAYKDQGKAVKGLQDQILILNAEEEKFNKDSSAKKKEQDQKDADERFLAKQEQARKEFAEQEKQTAEFDKAREKKIREGAIGSLAPIPKIDVKAVIEDAKKALDARNKVIEEGNKRAADAAKESKSFISLLFGVEGDDEAALTDVLAKGAEAFFFTIDAITQAMQRNIEDLRASLAQVEDQTTQTVSRINSIEEQLETARGARAERLAIQLQQQREKEAQLAAQRQKLEKKIESERKKQAALRKAADIAQATGATALGVVGALGNKPWTPFNFVLAALVGALGIAQVGIIASQKYGKGGVLSGNSHASGGIKTPFGEVEGGEAVINKNSTKRFRPILSAINEAGGGRKFAEGGVFGDSTSNFGNVNQALAANTSTIDYPQLANAISKVQVVTYVGDINGAQSKVNTINNRTIL